MGRPTLSIVWNWNKKKSKTLKYPLYVRVTHLRKSEYLNLKHVNIPNLLKEEVSTTDLAHRRNEWVQNRSDAFDLNQAIRDALNQLDVFVTEQSRLGQAISLATIKKQYLGKTLDKQTFNEYAENYILTSQELRYRAENTKKVYRTFLKKLNEYNPQWSLEQVNYSTVKLFIQWMRYDKKQRLRIDTIDKYTDKLRKIYHQASLEGLCPGQNHLTDGLKEIRQTDGDEDVSGESLTIEEIESWINVKLKGVKSHHRDVFLLCINLACYYNDLRMMRTNEIYQDNTSSGKSFNAIATKRFKKSNGRSQTIHARLSDRSIRILCAIHQVRSVQMLCELDSPLIPNMISDQKYREQLKSIAKAAKIKKNVTTRVSKYTGVDLLSEQNKNNLIKHTTGHTNEAQAARYNRKEGKEAMKQINPVDF